MERAGVVVGVDRDRRDPELGRRLGDPDRHFTAIGNEKLLHVVVASCGGGWWHDRRPRFGSAGHLGRVASFHEGLRDLSGS